MDTSDDDDTMDVDHPSASIEDLLFHDESTVEYEQTSNESLLKEEEKEEEESDATIEEENSINSSSTQIVDFDSIQTIDNVELRAEIDTQSVQFRNQQLINEIQAFEVRLKPLDSVFVQHAAIGNINWKRLYTSKEYRKTQDVAFVDFIPFLYHKLPNPNLRQESQKCTHCAFTTNVEERMLLHTGRHHLVCTECDQEFETKKELELHEQRFHTVEDVILYGCSLCNKSDQDKQRLCQHLSEHLQPQFGGGWLCHICLIKFASCETMKQHLQDRHILYKCTFCKQLSNEFESLESHCRYAHMHRPPPFRCSLCDLACYTYGMHVQHQEQWHAMKCLNRSLWLCGLCKPEKLLFTKAEVLRHLSVHCSIKLFVCNQCDDDFFTAHEMRLHFKLVHRMSVVDECLHPTAAKVDQILAEASRLAQSLRYRQSTHQKVFRRFKPTDQETDSAVNVILDQL